MLLKSLDKGEIRGFLSTAAPSPLSLIVRKVAYHCQRNILPPAFRRCAAWAATRRRIPRSKWSRLDLELCGSEVGRGSFDSLYRKSWHRVTVTPPPTRKPSASGSVFAGACPRCSHAPTQAAAS